MGQGHHRLAEMIRTHTLGVVAEYDAVQALLQPFLQPVQQLFLLVRIQVPGFLEIQPQHLLPATDHPQFRNGLPSRHGKQARKINAGAGHFLFQVFPMGIQARDPGRIYLHPQAGQVGRHVAGAPQHAFHMAHMVHRHRGFRRDPFHFPVDIAVQHHVADNRNPQFLDGFR